MFGFGSKSKEEKYMNAALKEANKAYRDNDVPIGCVIVNQDGKVIAKAHNRRNRDGSTLSHAELLAIGQACKKTGDWRLEGCTMYVTLEPCQMCAGAIVQARMDRVVIGCMNQKAGCCGSVLNLLQMKEFNHQVEIETGVLQEECSSIISDFFREIREEKQKIRQQEEEADQVLKVDGMPDGNNAAALPADEAAKSEPAARSAEDLPAALPTENSAPFRDKPLPEEALSAADLPEEIPAEPKKDLSDTDRLLEMDDLLAAALAEEEDDG